MPAARYLMCSPAHFGVEYVINPWMQGQIHETNGSRAAEQWSQLHQLLAASGAVLTMDGVPGLPDLVFTANAGLVYRGRAVVSRFRCPERQGESPYNEEVFRRAGLAVLQLPEEVVFEGAGDALLHAIREPLLWLGYGMRSGPEAAAAIAALLDVEVQPLRLVDPRFYHLDTCFCPLERGYLLYFPSAFDAESQAAIERRIPASQRIAVSDTDALHFACNAVNEGDLVIANSASPELQARLQQAGFRFQATPLTEFLRSGGAAKCLSLRLDL